MSLSYLIVLFLALSSWLFITFFREPNKTSQSLFSWLLIFFGVVAAYGLWSKYEAKNLLAIRKGLVAARDIRIGKVIEINDLMYARPATEIDSSQINKLIGKKSTKNITQGKILSFDMFN